MTALRLAVPIATLLMLAAPPAGAAPQILALLQTDGAVPLVCEDGACAGEFSGFCLQRERPDPGPDTRYRADGGPVMLVVTGRDGTARRLPAEDHLVISAERSYTAVRIAIPEPLLAEWDAVSVALEVGERVALVPVPDTADTDPQTDADIALALGPQRALGQRILQREAEDSGAVRLTNRMINALPPRGRTTAAERGAVWRNVVEPRAASYPPASVSRAAAVYRRCLQDVEKGRYFSLRNCLERRHDSLMIDLNVKYWEAGPEG